MLLLILGVSIFLTAHLTPSFPARRTRLVDRFGDNGYKGIYSLVSIIGMVMIVYGKGAAGYIELWNPPGFGKPLATPLMLAAIFLFFSSKAPVNVHRFTANPVSLSLVLWSIAHLLANGDLASLILFGSFGAFGAFSAVSSNRRGASTSEDKKPLVNDAVLAGASIVIYGLLAYFHGDIFGVALF